MILPSTPTKTNSIGADPKYAPIGIGVVSTGIPGNQLRVVRRPTWAVRGIPGQV